MDFVYRPLHSKNVISSQDTYYTRKNSPCGGRGGIESLTPLNTFFYSILSWLSENFLIIYNYPPPLPISPSMAPVP